MVSLTFDDGLTSQYQLAPILAAHRAHATFYLNTGLVPANDGAGRMSWANAAALAAAGHEIGGHTLTHVNIGDGTVPLEERRRQVCEDRANLVARGFSATSFAYATGGFDAAAQAIVRDCGYTFARTAGSLLETGPNYAETVPPRNGAYAVRALGTTYNGPITFEAMRTAAEAAYQNGGGWLPMLFHRICYQGTAAYTECMASYRPVDAMVIDQFLAWIDAHPGISARSMAEVFHGGLVPPPPTDTTAPVVAITSPAAGATVPTRTTAVSGTAGTAVGDDKTVRIEIYPGTSAVGRLVQTRIADIRTNGTWSATTDQLADGTYTVKASQGDAAGNTGSRTVTFTVDTTATPPAVSQPELTKLTRTVVGQGAENVVIRLTGAFEPTSKVSISGKGVLSRVVSRSGSSIELAVTVRSDAPAGVRTVEITNEDGGRATCESCLRVARGPRISELHPGGVARGRVTWVTIRGTGFTDRTVVSVGGKGVRVRSVRVLSPRRMKFALLVDRAARRTARSVTVTDEATLGADRLSRSLRVR